MKTYSHVEPVPRTTDAYPFQRRFATVAPFENAGQTVMANNKPGARRTVDGRGVSEEMGLDLLQGRLLL